MKYPRRKHGGRKINKVHLRWAFRLFIVSFFFFFGLGLFFYPTYPTSGMMTYVYSVFGQVPNIAAAYILLLAASIWIAGWAILWEDRKAMNSKSFLLTSWLIPISIIYAIVSLSISLMLDISRLLMTVISLIPPMLVVIAAPQIFVRNMLNRFELLLSRACLGLGIFIVAIWGAGVSFGADFLTHAVELVIPVYLGVLILEYLSLHLRLNGWRF